MNNDSNMMAQALLSMHNAYAPYSDYKVGAILRTKSGGLFSGCNVENAAYLGYEAVETAIGAMISDSDWIEQGKLPAIDSVLFCVSNRDDAQKHFPSGASLNHLRAFGTDNTQLHFATEKDGVFETRSLEDLLPHSPKLEYDRKEQDRRSRHFIEEQQKKDSVHPAFDTPEMSALYQVRLQAFSPYCHYAVGAIVRSQCGRLFSGCNYETMPHTSLHAEGVAIAKMVNALGPQARIQSIALITEGQAGFPCGDCRQKINEFCLPDTKVTAINTDGEQLTALHKELLPHSFGASCIHSAYKEQKKSNG